MKKQLLNLSFVAIALALYVTAAVAAPIAPVRTMEIPAAIPAPAMDGVAEAVYGPAQSCDVFNPTGKESDADFTASFQVCFDMDYLYLLATITDDVDHSYNWGVGNSWEFDNLEVFLQLDTNTVTTSYGATTIQLRVDRNLDSVESPGRALRTDYKYYMEGAAAGGWITEVAIPWTCALAEGAVPEDIADYLDVAIGFDFSAADSDNSDGDAAVGNRDVQAAWDNDEPQDADDRTEDLAWNNTSTFGYITLADIDALSDYSVSNLNAYPNPATDQITFDATGSIEVFSITGALVMVSEDATVDVSNLNSGVYLAKTADGQTAKFTVK